MAVVRSVYAAGAIDAVSIEEARDWQQTLSGYFDGKHIVVFSPAHPYFGADILTADIVDKINRAAIDACHALVAYIPPDRPVFGTIREIEYAHAEGKVVVVVAPGGLKSLLTYDLYVVPTLDEAANFLLDWHGR